MVVLSASCHDWKQFGSQRHAGEFICLPLQKHALTNRYKWLPEHFVQLFAVVCEPTSFFGSRTDVINSLVSDSKKQILPTFLVGDTWAKTVRIDEALI